LRKFGLIGYPLSHSFSKGFFAEKFQQEKIMDAQYDNYPIPTIDAFTMLWEQDPLLNGLNVTIPYKKEVISFLDKPSSVVSAINACNCIRKFNGELYGYNTDVIGFKKTLQPFLKPHHTAALILGTGGAAAAVEWVMRDLNIQYKLVSRSNANSESKTKETSLKQAATVLPYSKLTAEIIATHTLIINTSPLGMYPNVNDAPDIPYDAITSKHHLFDLIYNPSETLFLQKGAARGATIQNGLEMLHIQAEESWHIWNATTPIVQ
jgi:shikimate dehydrogenase